MTVGLLCPWRSWEDDARMKDLWKIEMALGADKTSARLSIGGYIMARSSDGQKGMTAARDVKARLEELPESVRTIEVELNSRGGEVPEGVEIYEALVASGREVVVNVVGAAYSVASIIMLAGTKRRISSMAQVMIHRPTVMSFGRADELRQRAEMLDKIEEQVLDLYEKKTKLSRAQLSDAMGKTTFYTAKEALAAGFATEIMDGDAKPAASNVLMLDEARERMLAEMGWRLPAVAAAAFFGDEPNKTETDTMNMALLKELKGIFGAEKAMTLCEAKPEAKGLGDFSAEMAAHVADLNKAVTDTQAKVTGLEAEKATLAGTVATLQDQVTKLGAAPVVITMKQDPSKPADKPGVCPANLVGKDRAAWLFDNTPAIQAEFGGDKAAAMAFAETAGWNL